MTTSLNTVISQMLPLLTVQPSNSHINQLVTAMASSLMTSANQPVLLNTRGVNLANLAKDNIPAKDNMAQKGIIKAVVISSTALTPSTASVGATDTRGQYTLLMSYAEQQFEIISKTFVPVGSQLTLKISENNQSAILLKIIDSNHSINPQSAENKGILKNALKAIDMRTNTAQQLYPGQAHTSSFHEIIEQGMRQSLPKQQPMHQLVTLLQQTLAQGPKGPKKLTSQINQLLQLFPTARQMQQTQSVKQAIENSGVFLETKLAHLAITRTPAHNNQIQQDIKASLQNLSLLVENLLETKFTSQSSHNTSSTPPGNTDQFGLPISAPTSSNSSPKANQDLDIILRQLSRQLFASIARTQLNQLESLNTRQHSGSENQGPVNTWVTEIPIVHGKHIDHLTLHIDQQAPEQQEDKEQNKQTVWTVMLAFDLHMLGKMNIQLKILNQTVSATVWSSKEKTHTQVKQHINELTSKLKSVGVSVTQVNCQLGSPPENKSPLFQQLVDVKT